MPRQPQLTRRDGRPRSLPAAEEEGRPHTILGAAAGTLPPATKVQSTITMSDAESSATRDALGFLDAVRREFSPVLAEAGFAEVRAQNTLVEFEGRGVFVNIVHGRSSYEIWFEIGVTESPEFEVSLAGWIEQLGGDPDRGWYSASTSERVWSGAQSVAKAFEEYAVSGIQTRDCVLLMMDRVAVRDSELWRLGETKQIRLEAEAAWRAKKLETVIRLYRQLRPEDLSALDRKRLAIAERLAQDSGGEMR